MRASEPAPKRTDPNATRALGRRDLLALGATVLASRVLVACGAGVPNARVTPARSALPVGVAATEGGAARWASGGTAAMTAKATYPDPFASTASSPTACAVTCDLTEGPCYSAQSVDIRDISYGYAGLPMRLQIRLLDETCKPLAGAVVDVWHVSPDGKYSGDDEVHEDVAFCTGGDRGFASQLYFRGKQTSDASGVVTFDSCFPGWYAGRTVHVHLTVTVGGASYVTTQLSVADPLADEIFASQPLYAARGKRDTTNATDGVFAPATVKDYELSTARMTDGAILAWKTLIVRSSLATARCEGGGGGPGRRGGPGLDGHGRGHPGGPDGPRPHGMRSGPLPESGGKRPEPPA